jgi:hypothetical protein
MHFPSPSKLMILFALAVGLFVFPMNGLLRAETVQAPTDTSASGELVFWNSIKKSENAADFEVYLKTFPDGMFAEIAQSRYKELGGSVAITAPKAEEAVTVEPEAKQEVTPEPEADVVVKKPRLEKKAPVIEVAKPKKRAASIFTKKKKTKVVLAYSKSRTKIKKAKLTSSKPKAKKLRPIKVRYVKPKAKPATKKVYEPIKDGSGGGGGGSGGGGGGWGG